MAMHFRSRAYHPIRPRPGQKSKPQLAACLALIILAALHVLRRLSFTDQTLAHMHAFSVLLQGEVELKRPSWTMRRPTVPELDYSGLGLLQRLEAQIDELLADLATLVDRILGRSSEQKVEERRNILEVQLTAKRVVKEAQKRAKENIQAAQLLLKDADRSARADALAVAEHALCEAWVSVAAARAEAAGSIAKAKADVRKRAMGLSTVADASTSNGTVPLRCPCRFDSHKPAFYVGN